MRLPLGFFSKRSINWKAKILLPYFKNTEKVLDFGCGDLSLAKSLKENLKFLDITGVDVVDFPERPKDIKFIVYKGKKLPFKDNSFDTVIVFYVFHHCKDIEILFKECARVASRRVLVIESVYRHKFEFPFMRIMDWIYNIVKPEAIPLSYNFLSKEGWLKIFKENKMSVKSKKINQVFLPSFIPIGISYIFEVTKKN